MFKAILLATLLSFTFIFWAASIDWKENVVAPIQQITFTK